MITPEAPPIQVNDLIVHPTRREVLIGETSVALTRTQARLLYVLARAPTWSFTRRQIIDAVHGDGYPSSDRAVDVQIMSLRRKLGPWSTCIETVRGVGYRFTTRGRRG